MSGKSTYQLRSDWRYQLVGGDYIAAQDTMAQVPFVFTDVEHRCVHVLAELQREQGHAHGGRYADRRVRELVAALVEVLVREEEEPDYA